MMDSTSECGQMASRQGLELKRKQRCLFGIQMKMWEMKGKSGWKQIERERKEISCHVWSVNSDYESLLSPQPRVIFGDKHRLGRSFTSSLEVDWLEGIPRWCSKHVWSSIWRHSFNLHAKSLSLSYVRQKWRMVEHFPDPVWIGTTGSLLGHAWTLSAVLPNLPRF